MRRNEFKKIALVRGRSNLKGIQGKGQIFFLSGRTMLQPAELRSNQEMMTTRSYFHNIQDHNQVQSVVFADMAV